AQVEEDGRIVMFNSVPRWLQRWTLDKTNRMDSTLEFLAHTVSRSPLLQPAIPSSITSSTSPEMSTLFGKNNVDLLNRLSIHDINKKMDILQTERHADDQVDEELEFELELEVEEHPPRRLDDGLSIGLAIDEVFRGRTMEITHSAVLE
ncbi:hypothetical protein EDD11_003991, partial [Mortierella claussenii]